MTFADHTLPFPNAYTHACSQILIQWVQWQLSLQALELSFSSEVKDLVQL